MTTDTLAKLAADLEQLASEGPELIHTQSGVYISQKLSEAAKALAAQDTTGAPSEPFGYFKAQPFGWTDCAETDDGAIALYEQPASQFTGAFSGIAARKLADLVDRGYRVNGYSLMHAETRARGFIDSGGFVGWWSNRDHEQAAQATAGWREQHDRDSAELRNLCQARDVARQQRDHARACYDSAVKLLTGIHALLYPAPITVPDGRTMVFRPNDLDPHAVLQELSDRIRALPDALAALSQPPQPQSAQEDAA